MKTIRQQGTVMVIILIILAVLVVSSLAFVTSTQSTTMVAGNIAFKDSASAVGDIGVELAMTALSGIGNQETNVPNQYYATQQPVDNNGIPTTVNWDNVPTTNFQNYAVQYVVERLCTGTLPIADTERSCNSGENLSGTSKKVGGSQYSSTIMYYRVTARVIGPKNSTSFIQAILSM